MPTPGKHEQEFPKLSPARLSLFIGAILAGVAVAILIAPLLFRIVPSDLTRIQVLLDALRSDEYAPEFIVLGSSVARDGLDARIISEELPGQPPGFNFGSPGQGMTEALMLAQEMPESVNTVVQVLGSMALKGVTMIDENKYNAYYMYGLRLNENVAHRLRTIYGEKAAILDDGYLDHAFRSRWAVRQLLDTTMRRLLREDLNLDRSTYDLYFPSSMGAPVSEQQLVIQLRNAYGRRETPFTASKQHMAQLAELAKRTKQAGRRFVLVLAPINPRALPLLTEDFTDTANQFFSEFAATHDFLLIDAQSALSADLFVDALHPSVEGADRFSRLIGETLARELEREGPE